MHYSETTFITSEEPHEGCFDVMVFTPAYELPFTGHPTLGMAYIVKETGTSVILAFNPETYSKENDLNVRVFGLVNVVPEAPATGSGMGASLLILSSTATSAKTRSISESSRATKSTGGLFSYCARRRPSAPSMSTWGAGSSS